jgi:hypothetical protein
MEDVQALPTVVGLFPDQAAAEHAVEQLARAGFTADEIGLVAPGDVEEPDYARAEVTGIAAGGALGGVAGALLGAVTAGVIPGAGPVLVAGAIVPIAVLAFTGASAGGTAGALFAAAAAQDQGLYYMQEVRSGRALVTVTTRHQAEARALLEAAGALEVADMGRSESAHKLAEAEDS